MLDGKDEGAANGAADPADCCLLRSSSCEGTERGGGGRTRASPGRVVP